MRPISLLLICAACTGCTKGTPGEPPAPGRAPIHAPGKAPIHAPGKAPNQRTPMPDKAKPQGPKNTQPTPAPVIPRSPLGASTYKLVGLSPNGRRMAFETSGVLENSNMNWAWTHVVEVDSNKVLGQPVKHESFGHFADKAPYVKQVATLLAKHGIKEVKPTRLARRKTSDEACRRLTFELKGLTHEVVATEKRWFNERCLGPKDRGTRVTLQLLRAGEQVRTLIQERALPTADWCSVDYRVDAVYHHAGVVMVALDYVRLGKGTTRNQGYWVVAGLL